MWIGAAEAVLAAVAACGGTAEHGDYSAERWYRERKEVYAVDHGAAWRRAAWSCFLLAAVLGVLEGVGM